MSLYGKAQYRNTFVYFLHHGIMRLVKITELHRPPRSKIGRIIHNDVRLENHEYRTVLLLAEFGFDVELIRPSSIPHSQNPDILMLGTTWEMKGPESDNQYTIKKRFRKAKKQADGRAIFDLNNIPKKNRIKAEKYILELFETTRGMKRIMLIKDGAIIDIIR